MTKNQALNILRNPQLRFHKGTTDAENEDKSCAAGLYLFALSWALSEGWKLPRETEVSLGRELRECALIATNRNKSLNEARKEAGKALLKAFGLEKGGALSNIEQAIREGDTNQRISDAFNIGKNEVPKIREKMIAEERERLQNISEHTLDIVGDAIDSSEYNNEIAHVTDVSERVRQVLRPQFRMLDDKEISEHVQEAISQAHKLGRVIVVGREIKRQPPEN